jgi:hypothetical protein
MQVQPRKKIMQRDVLVKNDTGAQMTFIDTDLFEWCVEEGIITNVRGFEREAMVGIGGQTLVDQMGDMKVCLEGSMVPVVLQVVPSESICDRNFQILLGTDNTKKLGAQIDLKEGVTRYTNLPGIDRVLSSMHLSPGTAKRVFNSRRVGYSDSVERPEYLSPRWSSESQIDRELGSIPLKVGEKAKFITAA